MRCIGKERVKAVIILLKLQNWVQTNLELCNHCFSYLQGFIVMRLKNLWTQVGLHNGGRGEVKSLIYIEYTLLPTLSIADIAETDSRMNHHFINTDHAPICSASLHLPLKLRGQRQILFLIIGDFNPLSANSTKWSNTLEFFEYFWPFCGVGA